MAGGDGGNLDHNYSRGHPYPKGSTGRELGAALMLGLGACPLGTGALVGRALVVAVFEQGSSFAILLKQLLLLKCPEDL